MVSDACITSVHFRNFKAFENFSISLDRHEHSCRSKTILGNPL